MLKFPTKYIKFLAFTLVMLMAIPCSAKKEMTHWLQLESTQQTNTAKYKTSCTTYNEIRQVANKGTVQNQVPPPFYSEFVIDSFTTSEVKVLFDIFNLHKEKNPTYLVLEQFLI